jgi:hypothetical protein
MTSTPDFDREREDTSNIVLLEHVNLQHPDQQLATAFYVLALQGTRDPYLMVGLDNMWINFGRTQMHLPTHSSGAQRLRGTIGLVVPDLQVLEASLRKAQASLAGTQYGFERHAGFIEATCPWGNRFRCHASDAARWGQTQLGIVYLELDVSPGSARAIADFYASIFGAPVSLDMNPDGLATASVRIGSDQRLHFAETSRAIAAYDGHHFQIYLADFSGPYKRLKERGLISRESNQHEWRFVDIVDLASGTTVCQIEHEVRSMRHPLFGRTLVNRNPAQGNPAYTRDHDTFRGSF